MTDDHGNQLDSPKIEDVKWGFMKVEGYPPGKDFKLFPGGKIRFIFMTVYLIMCLKLKVQKLGIGIKQILVMFLVFNEKMLKI
jgi:hypothetical protein